MHVHVIHARVSNVCLGGTVKLCVGMYCQEHLLLVLYRAHYIVCCVQDGQQLSSPVKFDLPVVSGCLPSVQVEFHNLILYIHDYLALCLCLCRRVFSLVMK